MISSVAQPLAQHGAHLHSSAACRMHFFFFPLLAASVDLVIHERNWFHWSSCGSHLLVTTCCLFHQLTAFQVSMFDIRCIAPSTPPPPRSELFAAFTMQSVSRHVMSRHSEARLFSSSSTSYFCSAAAEQLPLGNSVLPTVACCDHDMTCLCDQVLYAVI